MNDIQPDPQGKQIDLGITQEDYRAIMDTLQDSYFEADKTGMVTHANWGFIKNIGYSNRDDVIGSHFRHFTHRTGVRDVYLRFKQVFDTGEPVPPFEYRYRRKDGSLMFGDAYISPIIEGNEVVGTRGLIRDITDKLNAEQALRAAKTVAEARAEELAAVNRMATIVNKSLDFDEILQSVCVEFTNIFPVRNAGIALLNDDRTSQEIVAFHSTEGEESVLGLHIPLNPNDASSEAMETKKPVVIQDALSDVRVKAMWEVYERRGTQAIMIVPLLTRGNSIGTIGMPAKDRAHGFTQNEIDLAETIASQIGAAVDNSRLYAQVETALDVVERDLEIGRQIQAGFFPEKLPDIPGWEIATHFRAARQVAGDFYDVFQFKHSDLTAFVIADVCDKGVGAALFMVLFRSLLRAFSEVDIHAQNTAERLQEIVIQTNNFVAEIHDQSNMFATIFFGILDPESGKLSYINAGHEPPVVMDATGQLLQRLMPTGPAVGLFCDMSFHVKDVLFNPGDMLIGFTDGATDAKNRQGELFTEDRLLESIRGPWTSIFSMVFELHIGLQNHIGGQDQFDDITLISFRRKLAMGTENHAICRIAKIEILGELRDFVEIAAEQTGLGTESTFAFKSAAEEICAHIIQYGFEGNDPGYIVLFFERHKNKAILTIKDDGLAFPFDKAIIPDTEAALENRELSGIDLFSIDQTMDKIDYQSSLDGNTLTFTKFLE